MPFCMKNKEGKRQSILNNTFKTVFVQYNYVHIYIYNYVYKYIYIYMYIYIYIYSILKCKTKIFYSRVFLNLTKSRTGAILYGNQTYCSLNIGGTNDQLHFREF